MMPADSTSGNTVHGCEHNRERQKNQAGFGEQVLEMPGNCPPPAGGEKF
jgi:hypothetical protein